jgi:hypothetical protein
MIASEDGIELLGPVRQQWLGQLPALAYRLGETLGKVGKVEIGRGLIAFGLQTSIEALLFSHISI